MDGSGRVMQIVTLVNEVGWGGRIWCCASFGEWEAQNRLQFVLPAKATFRKSTAGVYASWTVHVLVFLNWTPKNQLLWHKLTCCDQTAILIISAQWSRLSNESNACIRSLHIWHAPRCRLVLFIAVSLIMGWSKRRGRWTIPSGNDVWKLSVAIFAALFGEWEMQNCLQFVLRKLICSSASFVDCLCLCEHHVVREATKECVNLNIDRCEKSFFLSSRNVCSLMNVCEILD